MPTIIDEKTVEHAVDAEFAYTDLKKNEDGKWEGIDTKNSDKLDDYKEANKVQINILAHVKDSSSGFQATLIEKTDISGNITKTIAIAGMDIWEGEDRTAAISISQGDIPGLQYKAMTDFVSKLINENKITKADNITMLGHSLGGSLTQLGLPSFSNYIDQAYTFNAPGAANFTATQEQANSWGWDSETNLYFNEFIFNKYNAGDKITNFTAVSGPTFIADTGQDIGIDFKLPGLWHGIAEMKYGLTTLLETGYTTQEQINQFTEQYKAIVEYYLPKQGLSFSIDETYLLKNPGTLNYLLSGIEHNSGKTIFLDNNTSFKFGEDNNLTINIDNTVSNTNPTQAINNLNGVLKIDQINTITTKTTDSISSYTVKSGDTLSEIAQRNNISLSDLLSANPNITDPNHINVWDNINLPQIHTSSYTVQAGDSISGIASKLGITTQSLINSNPWLETENRISENGKYILIKPEETLSLPTSDITSSYYINDGGQNQFYFNFGEQTLSQYDYSLGKWNPYTIDQYFNIDLGFDSYTPFLRAA